MREIRLGFVDFGVTVVPPGGTSESRGGRILAPGDVFLDVGNDCSERILDHHHRPDEYDSATRLATARYDDLVGKPLDGWSGPISLFTHRMPDLDGCAAMFYVHARLSGTPLPEAAWNRVVDMVSENDQGYLIPPVERSFPIIFRALISCFALQHREDPEAFVRDAAFPLIRECVAAEVGQDGAGTLWERLRGRPEWRTIRMLLERAQADYEDDRRRGRTLQIHLPRRESAPAPLGHGPKASMRSSESFAPPPRSREKWAQIDGMVLSNPQSLLFKELCRTDKEHSPQGRGFPLMLVHRSTGGAHQHIVSTDPVAGVSLQGLGALLEAAEKAFEADPTRCRKNGDGAHTERERETPGRHGYGVADPWYDGRGHDFTIIDNPAAGSVLSASEVEEILWRYGNPGHFIATWGTRMVLLIPLQVEASLEGEAARTFSADSLADAGWLRWDASSEAVPVLAPALLQAYRDLDGEGHAQHWKRVLPEANVVPEAFAVGRSLRLGTKVELSVLPTGLAFLVVGFEMAVGRGSATLFEIGEELARIRARAEELAKAGDRLRGEAVGFLLGTHRHGFVWAGDDLPFCISSVALDDASVDFGPGNTGNHAVLAQVAGASDLSLDSMPGESTLARMPRVASHCGRREVWFGDGSAALFELVPRPAKDVEPSGREVGEVLFQAQTHMFRLALFQHRFLAKVNRQAAHALDLPARSKARAVSGLNRALAEFATRWRTPVMSDTAWHQEVFDRLSERLRLTTLEQAARAQISQVAERIRNDNEAMRNRLIFLLTVVFFPLNLAAAMFSGVQMGPFSSGGGEFRHWLPMPSILDGWQFGGWVAFVLYLALFMTLGAATYAFMRLVNRNHSG